MLQLDKNFQTLSQDQHHLLSVIQEEYYQGMLLLNSIDKSVTVYGGARIPIESEDYQETKKIGYFFGQNGWHVITGGGPGAMAAALEGSKEAGGKTAAFRITLDNLEPQIVIPDIDFLCTQFSTRKYLLRQSDGFVVVPGGWGTLDELMELLNLIKTDKYPTKHVFLLNKSFWIGLVNWLEKVVCQEKGLVTTQSMSSFVLVDNAEEIAEYLNQNPD